jgi:glycosyltransferase involved in cell wall biosynthesis
MRHDFSVIVPCYNEEGNIQECIDRILGLGRGYEIVVVDDGSADRTSEKARGIKSKRIRVVGYRKNRGKGYAVREGIRNASGSVVAIQDADMATLPEELPDILKPIKEGRADFVNGSRFIYSMERGAMKGIHVFGNKIFAILVSILIRKRITDSLCGLKAFRKDMLAGKLKEDSWPDFELLVQAKRNGLRIAEVPVHYGARRAGKSKMKTFRHGWKLLRMLVKQMV